MRPAASSTIVAVQSTTSRCAVGSVVLVLDDPRRVAREQAREVLPGARATSSSAMNRVQKGDADPLLLGDAGRAPSAWLTPRSVPSSSTSARKLGVERTTARLKSRSRSSSRACRARSVKSRTMRTNSSSPEATTRPSYSCASPRSSSVYSMCWRLLSATARRPASSTRSATSGGSRAYMLCPTISSGEVSEVLLASRP